MQENMFLHKMVVFFKKLQFSAKDQLEFLEDFANLINEGIPPNKSVYIMLRCSYGIRREVANSIAYSIATGKPLAHGMKDWFNLNVVDMVQIGEKGGMLADSIKSAVKMMSARNSTFKHVIGIVLYPAIVAVVSCFLVVYLNSKVFSQFSSIKPVSQWPDAGKNVVALAHFLETWWSVVLTVIAVVIGAVNFSLKHYVGIWRDTLDKFFPFNLYKNFVAANLLETLGMLVSNGVVFREALSMIANRVTPYLKMHLGRMEILMGKGKSNIADVLSTGLISEENIIRARVLSEVKGFDQGLIRLGVRGSEQAVQVLKFIAKVTSGVLMLVGGTIIMLAINGVYQTGMFLGSQ